MRDSSPKDQIVSCRNCGKALPPNSHFCPNCSQKFTTGKIKFKDFILELIDNFFSLDARWFNTLKYIFWPGKLTKEFFLGRHRSYIHPIRIFLVVVAIFLYVLSQNFYNSDDSHLVDDDSFRLRLYKNYLLNNLNKDNDKGATNYQDKQKYILDSISIRISQLKSDTTLVKEMEKIIDSTNVSTTNDNNIGLRINSKTEVDSTEIDDEKVDKYFYIQSNDKTFKLSKEDFLGHTIEGFIQKNNLQIDTPPKLLIASLRKVKSQKLYEDTLLLNDFIEAKDTLSYLTDWSDPLKISISFSGKNNYRVALEDIRQLTVNQIINKFQLDNFLDQLLLKQVIKFEIDRKSFINFLFGTILWILICFIPIMALFMKLFYYRKKCYYIEHIVFLLHYHISMILMLTLAILLSDTPFQEIAMIFFAFYSFLILPYFGLKYYYNQSWSKTLFKGTILGFIYSIVLLIFLIFGLLISFFFY